MHPEERRTEDHSGGYEKDPTRQAHRYRLSPFPLANVSAAIVPGND
jgi:hypothetical protein